MANGDITCTRLLSESFADVSGNGDTSFVANYNNSGAGSAFNSQDETITAKKIGKMVFLTFLELAETMNNASPRFETTAAPIPAAYRPPTQVELPAIVADSVDNYFGRLVITSSGNIIFRRALDGTTNFATGAGGGHRGFTICYAVA